MTLKELSSRLYSLAVFRGLLRDPVMEALARCVRDCADLSNWDALGSYGEFVSRLYRAGGDLGRHIQRAVEQDENVCIRAAGRGEALPEYLVRTAAEELRTLQAAAELTPETLALPLLRSDSEYLPWFGTTEVDLAALYRERLENVGRYGWGMYARHHMFYLDEGGHVVPVRHPDETRLTELVDYRREQALILDNTRALLAGRPAANVLLTGDAGTGKSSTIKAVVNELYPQGLRIIEVRKEL